MQSEQPIRDLIQLLRLPFSLLLLPVYLFALSQAPTVELWRAVLVFGILHLLVYPASNAYNSLIDQDTDAIGGLEKPPLPPAILGPLTLLMDLLALGLGFLLHPFFVLGLLAFILASRAYSAPWPRLKQYPILSFLTVFLFQGAVTFMTVLLGVMPPESYPQMSQSRFCLLAITASCLVGGSYPLSQIYQHNSDAERGDMTLSRLLGYRRTLLFSGGMFAFGGLLLFKILPMQELLLLGLLSSPVLVYFSFWSFKIWGNPQHANFHNTMRMNWISASCLSLAFALLMRFK